MTIYNFQLLNVPFANTAIVSEIAPFPDYNRGLGIAFSQTDGKPEMKGLNGLFNIITASMLYLKQRGISEWDATLEYPDNAFVAEGAKLYKSKRTNMAKQPSLSQLDWDVWASISDISVSTNGNLKKTVASDGSVTLEVPTATDSQRGAVRQATATEVANKSNVVAYITPANASTISQSTDIGVGQAWQNLTLSRSIDMDYVNNTGKPIQALVSFRGTSAGSDSISVIVGGVSILQTGNIIEGDITNVSFIVPNSTTYSIVKLTTNIPNMVTWAELR